MVKKLKISKTHSVWDEPLEVRKKLYYTTRLRGKVGQAFEFINCRNRQEVIKKAFVGEFLRKRYYKLFEYTEDYNFLKRCMRLYRYV